MIHGKYVGQGEDLSEVIKIRSAVFEEEVLKEYDLHEEYDPMALNAFVDVEGTPVGAGRLVLNLEEDRFYVDDLCILAPFRGNQYGEFTLRMLADKAEQCNATELWAKVPDFASGFFRRFFFKEVGKENALALMKAQLTDFHTCCSHVKPAGE